MILPELEYTKKLFKKQWPGWNHDWNGKSVFHSVSRSPFQERGLSKSTNLSSLHQKSVFDHHLLRTIISRQFKHTQSLRSETLQC